MRSTATAGISPKRSCSRTPTSSSASARTWRRRVAAIPQLDFGLGTTEGFAVPTLAGTPTDVFTDAKIQNPLNGFELTSGGLGTESYLAGQIEEAVYLKVDALLSERWRLSGGVRQEEFEQASLPIDRLQFDPAVGQCALVPCDAAALERIHFVEDELYPAFSGTRIFNDVWAETSSCASGRARLSRDPIFGRCRHRRTSIR